MTLHQQDDETHGADGHARLRADDRRWNALELVGIQECDGLRGADDIIELRHCTCGSTLGRRTRRTMTPNKDKENTMRFEVYRDKDGEYRWRLLAANGQLTADSGEGYTRREDAHRAIASLLTAINDVVIVDA